MSRIKEAVTDVTFTMEASRPVMVSGHIETLYQYSGDNGARLMFLHTRNLAPELGVSYFTIVSDHYTNALGAVAAPLVLEQIRAAFKALHVSINVIKLC